MEYLMVIIIVLVSSITNVLCLFIGAKISQKIENKEDLKMHDIIPETTLNPFKLYERKKLEQEEKEELEKINIIMQNIENYDGTDNKQIDVPR